MPLVQLSQEDFTEDKSPALGSEEEVLFASPCEFHLDSKSHGSGVIFITSRNVIWHAADASGGSLGFSVDTRSVLMHAISRDTKTFPQACIYCQLSGDDGEEDLTEVRLVPTEDQLDSLYGAMCTSAELNPDEEPDENVNAGAGDWFFNKLEVDANMQAMMSQMSNFDGPDEEEVADDAGVDPMEALSEAINDAEMNDEADGDSADGA
jgi:hypothetical protein